MCHAQSIDAVSSPDHALESYSRGELLCGCRTGMVWTNAQKTVEILAGGSSRDKIGNFGKWFPATKISFNRGTCEPC